MSSTQGSSTQRAAARESAAQESATPRPGTQVAGTQGAGTQGAGTQVSGTTGAGAREHRPAHRAGRDLVGRIPILDVAPVINGGRFPAKAVVGEEFTVSATIFREGHDALSANAVVTGPDGTDLGWIPMHPGEPGTDRWHAAIRPDAVGDWTFTIEAWSHPIGTWWHAAGLKIPAGVDVELMLAQGEQLFERAIGNLPPGHTRGRELLADTLRALRDTRRPPEVRLAAATASDVRALLAEYPLREMVTPSEAYPLRVDRKRALYGSWYEFFPRSEGAYLDDTAGSSGPDGRWVSGTFKTAARRLPAIAEMGFDVIYLPPVHPIGRVNRKGPNNTLEAGPDDPGSPWAIGAAEGGHDAVHPDLGTIDDFTEFAAQARELGLEIALDLALQAAPDHPWVAEHPEWFTTLPDGSIAYAENPPKKYQDIYPLNFDNDPEGIYAEILRIVRHWMDHGVRIFRVDNPHTKPVRFWQRLLAEIRETDPDVLFLSEAFTRPAMLQTLAKVGFHQSYTYFTWRNTKYELESYLRELSQETSAFMRPNLFVNTQDILTAYLQYGGPAAFKIRAIVAAMASPTWGVYSGYELFEHVALRPGSEEYLDSEKYQYRVRDWAAYEPGGTHAGESLAPYLRRLNEIRREHPALHGLRNLRFHHVPDDQILAFSKNERLADGSDDTVIVVVNLDPHGTRESVVSLTMPDLGLDWHDTFVVDDELSGTSWSWGQHNFVRLDPATEPAHILTIRRKS